MIIISDSNIPTWRRRLNSLQAEDWFVTSAAALFVLVLLVFSRRTSKRRNSTTGQIFQSATEIPNDILNRLDAVLVLGGGVPKTVDEPPIFVQQRCNDAAAVVKRHCEETSHGKNSPMLPILTLSAGTAHLPQLMSEDGLPVWEATASAAYLQKRHGLKHVYVETTSYDTIGNAFYTRTSHTDVNGWRKLLIITNEFHMDRTKVIFDWIFGIGNDDYELYYLESKNVGLTAQGLEARRQHEQRGAKSVKHNLSRQFTTLKEVWGFLNHKHDLYAALKLADRARQADVSKAPSESLKESYGAK